MPTILIIEDEEGIREVVYDILTTNDFSAITAVNGSEGIQLAIQHQPDLILCDVAMPVLDGYGVLEQLKKQPTTLTTPFIFLTAKSSVKDLRQGMELGADDYLIKPFTVQELLNAIETRLNKQAQLKGHYEESLNQLRRNITAALPHELRTPLVGILGASEFLLSDYENLDGEVIREFLTDIHSSGERLYHLIQKYLQFIHLQERQLRQSPPPNVLGENAVNLTTGTAERVLALHDRHQDLVLSIEIEQLPLNSQDFRQLLEEILDNAAKFSDKGTPIHLNLFEESKQMYIILKDQGRGMTQTELASIGAYQQFNRDRFEQQGAGLGLAIAKLITQIYHGNLRISSKPEQGTTVHINIPRLPIMHSLEAG
ncbi:MAG: hybrid sensor histidine kinase/response regulator [Limnothrix sp. RL_2_0]|nr:hybrid sensor histidine kinase/response regulator [Limnothrix sp. RL_2_0]